MNTAKTIRMSLGPPLAAMVLVCACSGSDGDHNNTQSNNNASQPDAAVGQDAEVPLPDAQVQPDALSTHPETANCASCHAGVHGDAHDYPTCNTCHVLPGIPAFPAGHSSSGCTGCHGGSTSGTHAGYDTYLPQGCIDCHTP